MASNLTSISGIKKLIPQGQHSSIEIGEVDAIVNVIMKPVLKLTKIITGFCLVQILNELGTMAKWLCLPMKYCSIAAYCGILWQKINRATAAHLSSPTDYNCGPRSPPHSLCPMSKYP